MKTLKHIPIPNKNELDDSKLESIVQKWSTTTKEPSSSPSGEDKSTTATGARGNSTDDNNSNTPSGSDGDTKLDEEGGNSSHDESSKEDKAEGQCLLRKFESVKITKTPLLYLPLE